MIPEALIALARYVADQVGRRPRIFRWSSNDGQEEVSVAIVDSWPTPGDVTACTIDLITTPLGLSPGEYELLMTSEARWAKETEQLVANAGLKYRMGDIPWAPGATYFDALPPVVQGATARHLVAIEPIEPELRLKTTLKTGVSVRWLQLVPVTDSELEASGGSQALAASRWRDLARGESARPG
jgi:hypothetical protein